MTTETQAADITILLDRSGSMQSIRNDTIGGVNAFIEDQQKVPGEAFFSLVQFDTEGYDRMCDEVPLAQAPLLTLSTFRPRSGTPLLDAIGRAIAETGERLSKKTARKVIFVIVTDGAENSSREFTRDQVFKLVSQQREEWKWEFVFLAANQDAIGEAMSMGFHAGQAMNYAPTAAGVKDAYASVSSSVVRSRTGGSGTFTADERARETGAPGVDSK